MIIFVIMIPRPKDLQEIKRRIKNYPVTAILGARQVGKTTIARMIGSDHYFDLENPEDLIAFDNPSTILNSLRGLIIIDEIQRKPELFPLLRYMADYKPDKKYLILGSASRELIRQSSESLAGRISYYYLGGFTPGNVSGIDNDKLWIRGGFPRSFLAKSDQESYLWRTDFINTFLERDIPQLGITIPSQTLRRFWVMLAHYNGQIMNYSEIARSFGISDMTVRHYLDILEGTFMIRQLQPYYINLGKRLVKRPKIYFMDPGIFHALLTIKNKQDLLVHPKLGASWESFVMENLIRILNLTSGEVFFYRTHNGTELDLFWLMRGKNYGAEIRFSDAPAVTKSMKISIQDLKLSHLWVIYPGTKKFRAGEMITILPFTRIEDIMSNS